MSRSVTRQVRLRFVITTPGGVMRLLGESILVLAAVVGAAWLVYVFVVAVS